MSCADWRRGPPARRPSSLRPPAGAGNIVAFASSSSMAAGSERLLREPVALRQRRHLVGVDAIDQPIEMIPEPRIGPGAVRRLEQESRWRDRTATRPRRGARLSVRFSPASNCCCEVAIRVPMGSRDDRRRRSRRECRRLRRSGAQERLAAWDCRRRPTRPAGPRRRCRSPTASAIPHASCWTHFREQPAYA